MEQWTNIQEPKEFFETIIEAKERVGQLFDKCKNVNGFVNEQLDRYRELLSFLDTNRDNFAFLPEEQRSTLETFRGILKDEKPWESMPSYLKMMRTLKSALEQCRKKLIEKIKENYNKVFDDLDAYAAQVGVSRDKYADREKTIFRNTQSNNFYALEAAADVSDFHEHETQKISDSIPAPQPNPQPQPGPNPQPQPKPAPRKRKVIHLNTHTTQPMRSEADVDLYLASLKADIMGQMGNDIDIIIS